MIRAPVRRIVGDLASRDEDIATYAAMNVLRLKEVSEEEIDALLPALRRATTSESISVRFFARKALNEAKRAMRRHPRLLEREERVRAESRGASWNELLEGLRRSPTEKKLVVVDLLKDVDDPAIVPALLAFIDQEEDEFVLAEAIRVLGTIGSSSEAPAVSRFLRHRDSRIRSNAVEALERIGGKEVIRELLPLLEDDDNRVRGTVARILGKHGQGNVLAALAEMLRSVEVWMRESAIYALAHIPAAESVDLLLEALVDTHGEVRVKAIESLAKLRSRKALDYLQAIAAGAEYAVAQAASTAVRAIRRDPVDYEYADTGRAEQGGPRLRRRGRPLIGRSARRAAREAAALVAGPERDELLELGKKVLALYRANRLERPPMDDIEAEAKKLEYLVNQKEAQKSAIGKESRRFTFIGFLRESLRFVTQQRQVDQRLDLLQARLDDAYRNAARRYLDDAMTRPDADKLLGPIREIDKRLRELK